MVTKNVVQYCALATNVVGCDCLNKLGISLIFSKSSFIFATFSLLCFETTQ